MIDNGKGDLKTFGRLFERRSAARPVATGLGLLCLAGVAAAAERSNEPHLNIIPRTDAEAARITAVTAVPDTFDARHSAVRRHYRYRILNRRPPPALERHAWHVAAPLDAAAMHEAAQHLVGRHDFTTYRASQCQAKSPVRTLETLTVARDGEMVIVTTDARAFLHNQVRAMVGTLVEVGAGRWAVGDVADALEAADRTRCGPVAPALGLTLTGVDYPPDIF